MDSAKVDAQRDIVKNERRQSYENQPYGKAVDILPAGHVPEGPSVFVGGDRVHG